MNISASFIPPPPSPAPPPPPSPAPPPPPPSLKSDNERWIIKNRERETDEKNQNHFWPVSISLVEAYEEVGGGGGGREEEEGKKKVGRSDVVDVVD